MCVCVVEKWNKLYTIRIGIVTREQEEQKRTRNGTSYDSKNSF